jgi:succinoglycan biosynthesis protein ExoM
VGDPTVTVAVLTYKRPDDLAAALPLLAAQAAELDPPAELLVVDNDPAAGARGTVTGARYVHEPTPGIAAGRNRALDEATTELLVFVDDDERPVPGWLRALVDTWQATRPAGVVGPVTSEFAHEPDPWITAGRFFDRRRLPTGAQVRIAATNNLLLDLAAVGPLRFDPRYGLTGGSDTLFTGQLTAAGGRLVWCAEAGVVDVVPAARLTRRWVLRRAFRSGNAASLVEVELAGSGLARTLPVRVRQVVHGLVRVGGGGLRLLAGVPTRSVQHRARGARTLARGAGLVAGAVGYTFAEYARRAA